MDTLQDVHGTFGNDPAFADEVLSKEAGLDMRRDSMREAALSYGARGGLARGRGQQQRRHGIAVDGQPGGRDQAAQQVEGGHRRDLGAVGQQLVGVLEHGFPGEAAAGDPVGGDLDPLGRDRLGG